MLATVLASLPYYVAGFADQPAASGTYDYDGPAELWNVLVTLGHALMAVVVLAFVGLWLKSDRVRDADAAVGDDPWGGQTLEWLATSPAPLDNFAEVPTVMSPEPVLDLQAPDRRASADARAPRRPGPAAAPAGVRRHRARRRRHGDAHRRHARGLDPPARAGDRRRAARGCPTA